MRARPLALTLLATLATAACADRSPSAPGDAGLGARSGSTASSDTTVNGAPLPASVRVHGQVLASTTTGPRAPGDTLSAFVTVAGARVTLYRNVLVDGKGVSVKLGERTTAADGAFDFANVPGGYYVLSLNVTPDRFYGETYVLVAGTRADVTADIRIW